MIKSNKPSKLTLIAKRNVSSEALEQAMFFRWLATVKPYARKLTFAVPNGGTRHIGEAVNLKKAGVTAGVCDVFMAVPTDMFAGLFLEFKYGKNKPTELQSIFIAMARDAGYRAEVVYSCDEAMDVVLEYLRGSEYD